MARRLAAEFAGTAMLVAIVVGSGIAADRLSDTAGLALLINAFATGAGLVAIILAFGPASGGHFNPVVSLSEGIIDGRAWAEVGAYMAVQVAGGLGGVVIAEIMFDAPVFAASSADRMTVGLLVAEALATAGLIAVILGCVRGKRPPSTVAFAVGAYIASAYFFTSSTSFANPAVTIARVLTDTFAGISPASALAFVPVQFASATAAIFFMRWLYPALTQSSDEIAVPGKTRQEAAI